MRSYLHVIFQFVSIFCILFLFNRRGALPWYFVFTYLGVILAVWAIWVMRKSNLTVMPDPGMNFKIISDGPYRLIRHPMYASLFLFLFPLVIYHITFLKVAIFILFAINQVLKLRYEEKIITDKFPRYADYMQKTWRLVPYVF